MCWLGVSPSTFGFFYIPKTCMGLRFSSSYIPFLFVKRKTMSMTIQNTFCLLCLINENWLIIQPKSPLCFLAQRSMTASLRNGCRVVERGTVAYRPGVGVLLEQPVVRLRVWRCLGHPRQQGPAVHHAIEESLSQWLLGYAYGRGTSASTGSLTENVIVCVSFSISEVRKNQFKPGIGFWWEKKYRDCL